MTVVAPVQTSLRFVRDDLEAIDPDGCLLVFVPSGRFTLLGETYSDGVNDDELVSVYDAGTTMGKPLPTGWRRRECRSTGLG